MLGTGFVVAALLASASAGHGEPAGCAVSTSIERVCGVAVPEDIVHVPNSPWIIASSMPRDGSKGGLFLIDTRVRRAERVEFVPDPRGFAASKAEAAAVAQCPAPDPAKLTTHGLSLSEGPDGVHRLYVVGHGGREAIELFNVDSRAEKPVIAWAGCVPLPEGLEANSVVGLPEGGLVFSSLYDRDDHDWNSRIGKLAAAAPAGGAYEWRPGSEIRGIKLPPASGPNGTAVSNDGKSLYVAGWGDRVVRRVGSDGRETAPPLTLDFLPDNLHWAPDGTLLAAGQQISVKDLFACISAGRAGYCAKSYSVARIDAANLTLLEQWHARSDDHFGDSTSALMVDGKLWIGAINGECIAVIDPQSTNGTASATSSQAANMKEMRK